MSQSIINELLEQRRTALVDYCLGFMGASDGPFNIIKNVDHLNELLHLDSLDSHKVPSARGAEAISCAQKFIHAAYQKLEPGYLKTDFHEEDLKRWEFYRNYPDWAALRLLTFYPENYMTPFARPNTTRLFQALVTDLNQARLSTDSVLAALRNYLKSFEEICNVQVISAFLHGKAAVDGRYFFVGRERVPPFRHYWREAKIQITPTCISVNPAAWKEWSIINVGVTGRVLDMRPVFWSGRSCLIWAELTNAIGVKGEQGYVPFKLDINVAFQSQNGDWSPTSNLQSTTSDVAPAAGSRLIATVRSTEGHPDGCLGVLFFNGDEPSQAVVRDALFRPVPTDDGGWLKKLAERFANVSTVQHSLTAQTQPKIATTVSTPGKLTVFLELEAFVLTRSTGDILAVRGVCKANNIGAAEKVEFDLTLSGTPSGDDPKQTKGEFSGKGEWGTEWLTYKRDSGGFTSDFIFTFGATSTAQGYGRKQFVLNMRDIVGFDPAVLESNRANAAQFLAFKKTGSLARVRLNSLFGPRLVALANVSVDAVLDWTTQFLEEPDSEAGAVNEPNGAFNGANGLYFWELFFHLPHLLAIRLRDENRYREAETWLRRIFDPQSIADTPSIPVKPSDKPLYWRCRPLVSNGHPGYESEAGDDPYAISMSKPRHFQILAFIDYVINLMEEGDWYYRQQTRDSLVVAKQCYQQAQRLMGDPPLVRSMTDWQAQTLGTLIEKSAIGPALEAFEKTHVYSLANIAPSAITAPALGLFASERFKLPTNERLLSLFQRPRQRLHNLREWLTIDGKPLDVPLYEAKGDPAQLLRDLAAGGSTGPRPMGGRAVINAYNWRVTFELALRSVQALQEYGNQVLRFMEQSDAAKQGELQQRHLVEQSEWTKTLQEKSIAQMKATLAALCQSRETVQQRADVYSAWHDEDITDEEYKVMDDLHSAKQLNQASVGLQAAAGAISAIPKIFGVANGGALPEGVPSALAYGLQISSMSKQADAEKRSVTEGYRQRRREWELQRNLAQAELLAIDEQINAQTIAVKAAESSLELAQLTNRQALAVYDFLQKRSTHSALYGWLLGQLRALYYQAFDAAYSLCSSAQASRNAQTGDYELQVLVPQAWSEQHGGLTAGDQLRGFLMRMERNHVQSFERRLERVKTVSLRELFDDAIESQPDASSWAKALEKLKCTGRLAFHVSELNLNRGNPGEYCRLIRSVEVDVPALFGPFQNAMATLTQTGSRTVIRPAPKAVEYLHESESSLVPEGVLFNTRVGQQIGISRGLAEDGRVMEDQDAGLLRPFEHTGVDSSWLIDFPWPKKEPQESVLASLTDIILHIRYTAKVGEPTFRLAVENLVTAAEARAAKRNVKRSGGHG